MAEIVTHRSAPGLSGVQLESANYQIMGVGLTDRIFLLGHGGLTLNNPYQVIDIQIAIDALGADTNAPLMRGMIEAYYAGSRDLYLVAVAPMVEYVPFWIDRIQVLASTQSAAMLVKDPTWTAPPGYSNDQWDSLNFFQRYAIRLQNAYALLKDWDLPQIIVPINAYYYNVLGTDFLTPLAQFCEDHFDTTGSVCIGFLGGQLQKGILNDTVIEQGWTADIIADIEQGLSGLGAKNEPFRLTPTSYITSPDNANFSVTGDIDLRAVLSLDHWINSATFIARSTFVNNITVGQTGGSRYNGFLLYETNGLDALVRIREGNIAGRILDEIPFNGLQKVADQYPVGLHVGGKIYLELVSGAVSGFVFWSPPHARDQTIISKTNVTSEESYLFSVTEEGKLAFGHSSTNTGPMTTETSTAVLRVSNGQGGLQPVLNGDKIWIRVTLRVDDGLNNSVTTFYTSIDGLSWDISGEVLTRPGTTSIYDGVAPLGIGTIPSNPALAPATGWVYYIEIRAGINGTIVANPSFLQLVGGV